MKQLLLCCVICLLFAETVEGQKKFGINQTRKEVLKINRVTDPEKAIKDIETIIPQISNRRWQTRNFRLSISLRLADLYIRTGEFQKAEAQLTSLVTEVDTLDVNWTRAMFPQYNGTIYDCYDHLGYYFLMTGNLKKAEDIFQLSKLKRDKVFPPRSVHRLFPLVGMGSLNFRKNNFDETYRIFNDAEKKLNRATTTYYDFDNVRRLYLSDLAEICMIQGRSKESLDYLDKLSIASSGIAKFGNRIGSRLELARIFELKARYYLIEGEYKKAQEYLDRANKYYSSKIASSDIKFKLLKTQALVFWFEGDLEKSNAAFLSLVDAYRQNINQNFISMSEYEKEQFYNTLKSDFNLFNAYALELDPTQHAVLFEAMLNNALNTKALLLNESNKIKNEILSSGNTALIIKLHQWEEAKSQLSSYYFDKDAVQKIDSLERKVDGLEKEINTQSRLFSSKENSREWQQIRATLKEGEAAIEIIRINRLVKGSRKLYGVNSGLSDSAVYLALIIKPETKTPEFVLFDNGNQMEERYLSFYRNSILTHVEDKASYDIYWRPLKPHLQGVKKVYLSPDGVFNQLNLNILKNPASNQFLIDEMELVYLTNTADLLREKEDISKSPNAVLVGRPSYDLTRQPPRDTAVSSPYGTRFVMSDEMSTFKEQEFADLPGTEKEIDLIEKALIQRNIKVTTFKGDNALEENVRAVHSPDILHIATHGFFVDDAASVVSPMIRSGLILAGVKNQEQQQNVDGILTAYEATNLNLDKTSLVVLSACETGLGEVRNGEGVYGLQRAIIVAGANNLLMSLWKVDDEATALLMIELYNGWEQGKNQQAFRAAQLAMRKQYPDPFYWGAFIMLGK